MKCALDGGVTQGANGAIMPVSPGPFIHPSIHPIHPVIYPFCPFIRPFIQCKPICTSHLPILFHSSIWFIHLYIHPCRPCIHISGPFIQWVHPSSPFIYQFIQTIYPSITFIHSLIQSFHLSGLYFHSFNNPSIHPFIIKPIQQTIHPVYSSINSFNPFSHPSISSLIQSKLWSSTCTAYATLHSSHLPQHNLHISRIFIYSSIKIFNFIMLFINVPLKFIFIYSTIFHLFNSISPFIHQNLYTI